MRVDDPADDSEADAHAVADGAKAAEEREHALEVLGRDALTGVADPELPGAAAITRADLDAPLAVAEAILERVADEVHEDLLQRCGLRGVAPSSVEHRAVQRQA